MSPAVRRLVSVVVVAIVAGVGVAAYLHGGKGDDPLTTPAPGPVDRSLSPSDLEAKKARAGIADCSPGPGGGGLPSVTLSCLAGGTSVDLASLRGPMIISFWASWCGPCGQEMPALQSFSQHHGQQVPVLGVDFLDQYPGSALDLMKHTGATYPSLTDASGVLQSHSVFAKILHLPVLVFLDARGDIAYEHAGGVDSESEVADLVREHLGVDL